MAVTPKIVRRNNGGCQCRDRDYHNTDDGFCKYKYCVVFRCRKCHGQLFSMGPVGCECSGGPRWARHRGMKTLAKWDAEKDDYIQVHAAIKPSIAKRRQRGRN